MLGSSWLQLGPLGRILALSWAILGSLGGHLGSSWTLSGATNHAKTVGKRMFGDIMPKINKADACFTILSPCCGHVGPSEAPSWAMLSEVGALLGSICGQVVAILGPCWPILAPIWASPEPMLSLGLARSCQVEPMLADLALKRRSVEAISADFQRYN